MSAQSLLRDSSCAQNTAHKSLPTQKNTKLYGRHRTPYNLVFIWCFNLQNGQLRKVTIHIFESHKSPQYGTFQHFALLYGGNQLLLEKEKINSLKFLQNARKRDLLIFLVFFIPGTPKDLLTYFAGLTNIKLTKFLLISTVARIPSIVTSTVGGNALGMENYLFAVIVFAATALLSGIGILIYSRLTKNEAGE